MYSIKNNSINELIIKNSKFITLLYKVDDINKINYYLDKVKETYKDATHYCYAYIISDIKRSSDDNEPSGTAGIPMLDVLEKNNLNNVLAIVVRYFGGIKLGSGGLIRAYSKSVRACLNLVDKVKLTKGYNIDIMVGWGMTEIASCGTFTKENAPIKLGSAGIPLSKNVIKILPYNEDNVYDINANGLAVNQKGMLFFSSPSRMQGYYKRPELTEETILTDNEGTKWIKTGDLAWVDSDGYIFFEGRAKRIVVRPDGHNIPGEYIETIANSYDQVKSAVVVGVKSTNYPHGSYAGLCIERNNDSNMTDDELLTIIDKMCCEKLQPRDRVKYYIITNIPYTANNKVDYDKLQIAVNQLIQELEINEDDRESFFILEGQVLDQKIKSTKTLKRIFKTKR